MARFRTQGKSINSVGVETMVCTERSDLGRLTVGEAKHPISCDFRIGCGECGQTCTIRQRSAYFSGFKED